MNGASKSVGSVSHPARRWENRLGPDPQEPLYQAVDFEFPVVDDMKISARQYGNQHAI